MAVTEWGACECKLFAQEGARVAIADIRDEDGLKVEAEIREAGGDAAFFHLDVTQEEDWTAAVDGIAARYGKLDILVNNAGISSYAFTDTMGVEGWDRIMEINAKSVLFWARKYAVPKLLEAGGGSIVNISSIAGITGSEIGHPAYNSSKAAVRLFTKAMAAPPG